MAPTKNCINAVLPKLQSAWHGPNQTHKSFDTYIVATCKCTDITNNNKCMFILTGWRLEICIAIRKGEVYLTFDVYLKSGDVAETSLSLIKEYNKYFKSTLKG